MSPVKPNPSSKASQAESWPRKVTFGRESVTVYRRRTPSGNIGYQVANYSGPKRRLDSYATATEALEAASKIARQLSQRDVLSASMTKDQTIEYANAIQMLQPTGISLTHAISTIVDALKLVGDLPGVIAAARFYNARNKTLTNKLVSEVVTELIQNKEQRDARDRYIGDLRSRLGTFAKAFQCHIGNVHTADVQAWLDGLKTRKGKKISTQTYTNFRRAVSLLFSYAVTRRYAVDNPIDEVETVKVVNGDIEVYTPSEIGRLLTSASKDYLPCLAIGAFAGIRSSEIERLRWKDINLTARHINIGKEIAKTGSRRIVPVSDNLFTWLNPYIGLEGNVWNGTSDAFYKEQQEIAKVAGIAWKENALRNSYISYRLATIKNVPQVAYEAGNSPDMVKTHYMELVTQAEAVKWFNVVPVAPLNVISLTDATVTG